MQTVKTEAAVPVDPDQLHETVLQAYEAIGFPRAIVGSWAISENDVKDFVSFAIQAQPKKILEVGTYVGVSTMLMALACPEVRIFTVDPDLPLEVEMSSARSNISGVNAKVTTHAIARQAATRLGIAKRIQFVRGGFAVGDTFSSVMQAGGSTVDVVGPRLCKEEGPFDFIFVDGLHSAEAVAADLELASKALTPDGVIVLHDCVGYWGASVRSGVLRFLRKHPDFLFTHPAYSAIYKSVGVLSPRQSPRTIGYPVRKPFEKNDLTPGLRATIARLNATLAGERPVLEISFGEPVLTDVLSGDATSYSSVSLNSRAAKQPKGGGSRPIAAITEKLQQTPRPAVFSADLMDFSADAQVEAILDALKAAKAPLVLALTPPGETGVAGPQSRSIATVIDLAEKHGLAVYALPALDVEFERYALLPQPRDLGRTSLFTSFVVIDASGGYADGAGRPLIRLSAEAAAEQEQLELQRVHLAAGYWRYYNDRNVLLESNSKAGDLVRRMESKVRGLETELASGAERNNTETLKLATRFADLSESLRQFELQRVALEQKLEAERAAREQAAAAHAAGLETINVMRQEFESAQAEAKGLAQQLATERDAVGALREQLTASEAARRATEQRALSLAQEYARTEQILSAALEHERARAADLSLMAVDVFDTIDFADSTLQTQEQLLGETTPNAGSGDSDDTFEELQTFRRRIARTNELLHAQFTAWRAQAISAQQGLDAVHTSTSWKLTAPLRSVSHIARRAAKGPIWVKRRVRASIIGRQLVALAQKLDLQLAPKGLRAPVFDEHHYATFNMDVPAAEAMRHYLMFGEKEGRRPNRKFDPAFYVQQYPDVAASGVSPLLHFLSFGVFEGRSPCAELHPLADLAQRANVAPLEYFARS